MFRPIVVRALGIIGVGSWLSISLLFDCISQPCNTCQTSGFDPTSQSLYRPRPFTRTASQGLFRSSISPSKPTSAHSEHALRAGHGPTWSSHPFSNVTPRNPLVLSTRLSPSSSLAEAEQGLNRMRGLVDGASEGRHGPLHVKDRGLGRESSNGLGAKRSVNQVVQRVAPMPCEMRPRGCVGFLR